MSSRQNDAREISAKVIGAKLNSPDPSAHKPKKPPTTRETGNMPYFISRECSEIAAKILRARLPVGAKMEIVPMLPRKGDPLGLLALPRLLEGAAMLTDAYVPAAGREIDCFAEQIKPVKQGSTNTKNREIYN
jgi:hypothetical protein